MKKFFVLLILFSMVAQAASTHEEIIACTILGEARGEGTKGMYAIGAVIKQRCIDRNMSPAKVCLQKKQFSCNNKGVQYHLLSVPQAKYALFLAKNILKLDLNVTKKANHYHNNKIKKPYWAKGQNPVIIIKNHIFYRIK
jgi:spore germination cell wall hydrolase CwlJ-like protein